MRFADFFARSFASVSAPQLPWVKMLKESPVAKIAVIPLCHISVSVHKTSVDWIALKSPETLTNFVLWCLDDIIANLANQQSVTKGSKKSVQQIPSSNQVEIFVVLAIALRWKPDALLSLLSKLRDNPDIKDNRNSHMLFGLLHRILSGPKARSSLLNRAVRKGERLLLHAVFDLLMRMTFPAPTALVKNEEALSMNMDTNKLKSIKEADKCCKAVLGKITHHSGCLKGGAFVLLLAIGVYFAVFPSLEPFDWEKLRVVFDSLQSS